MEDKLAKIRRDTIEECIKAVRDNCSVCEGTGISRYEPETYVSRDMALDAEQPEREGSLYSPEICEACEYCGRPIDAIRVLLKEEDTVNKKAKYAPPDFYREARIEAEAKAKTTDAYKSVLKLIETKMHEIRMTVENWLDEVKQNGK